MRNVLFRITSQTTGEIHFVITDKNGYVNTEDSWNSHDSMDDEVITSSNGIWFNGYNNSQEGAQPSAVLGALPYDTYLIEEMECEANKGYTLIDDIVTISRDHTLVKLGTYVDKLLPEEPEELDEPEDDTDEDENTPQTGDSNWLLIVCGAAAALAIAEVLILTAIKKNDRLCPKKKRK